LNTAKVLTISPESMHGAGRRHLREHCIDTLVN
jgi:hypothetical protein